MDISLASIALWAGVSQDCGTAWATAIGLPREAFGEATHPRAAGEITESEHNELLGTVRVKATVAEGETVPDPRPLTLFQKTGLRSMWRVAVYVCTPRATEVVPEPQEKVIKPEGRKLKTSNLIDPTDETEIAAPSSSQVDVWYANYKAIKYGEPLPEFDPSPEQIAALSARIMKFGQEPYTDFSLLTPYGRRFQKRLRHRRTALTSPSMCRAQHLGRPGRPAGRCSRVSC